MTTAYALLLARCGLSLREAAEFHGVRADTIKSWSSGRRTAPDGAVAELRELYARIERAAAEAIKLARKRRATELELGLASDDHEARSIGWPCVGAQAAAFGLVAARLNILVKIVPRGSTVATAAAADVHDHRPCVQQPEKLTSRHAPRR